jgi:hypothetical protein
VARRRRLLRRSRSSRRRLLETRVSMFACEILCRVNPSSPFSNIRGLQVIIYHRGLLTRGRKGDIVSAATREKNKN